MQFYHIMSWQNIERMSESLDELTATSWCPPDYLFSRNSATSSSYCYLS